MFNDLVIKYNKEDKGKNIKTTTANDILNVNSRSRSIIKATIPELHVKDLKVHSIAKKETVFDPLKTKDTVKIKEQDPFKFLFGFSVEPDDRPLPNAYRYKSILNDNPANVALDRAEITRDLRDGILEEQTKTGNSLSGSEDFMRYYTELRASEFAVPKTRKAEFDAEPGHKYSSKRNFIDNEENFRKQANDARKNLYEKTAEKDLLTKRTIEVQKAIDNGTIPAQIQTERRKLRAIQQKINDDLEPEIAQAKNTIRNNRGRYDEKSYDDQRRTVDNEHNEKILNVDNLKEQEYANIEKAMSENNDENLTPVEYFLMVYNSNTSGQHSKMPKDVKDGLIRAYTEICQNLNKRPSDTILNGSSKQLVIGIKKLENIGGQYDKFTLKDFRDSYTSPARGGLSNILERVQAAAFPKKSTASKSGKSQTMSTSSSGNSTIPLNSSRGRSKTGETQQRGEFIPEGGEHVRQFGRDNLSGIFNSVAGGGSGSGSGSGW